MEMEEGGILGGRDGGVLIEEWGGGRDGEGSLTLSLIPITGFLLSSLS